jgi:hypothetical protein
MIFCPPKPTMSNSTGITADQGADVKRVDIGRDRPRITEAKLDESRRSAQTQRANAGTPSIEVDRERLIGSE